VATEDAAVIQLVTRCDSAEEFIERFARFTTETDVVVPALPHMSVGMGGPFAICLRDRSVIMKGRCEITEIRPAGAGVPALMRLRVREMDAHSCGIHLRLMERHASSARPAAPGPGVDEAAPEETAPAADASAVTVVGGARPEFDNETTAVSAAPRPETRVPGAAFTLPANPLSDLDGADLASFVELTLLESGSGAPTAKRSKLRLDRTWRVARRVVPYAVCALVGGLGGFALRPDAKVAVVVGAPSVVAEPVATPPPASEPLPPPEFEPMPPPASDPMPSAAPAVAEASRPAPRDAGSRVTKLVVTSSPPHAMIKLNRRRVGTTPRTIDAGRFERVRIEASLPGYRKWKKTVYLKDAEAQIDVRLVRAGASVARQAPPSQVAQPIAVAAR
jgi:hypothetical protein